MIEHLAENALPIWVGGAVLLTFAAVVYVQTRSGKALAVMGVIVILTAGLLVVEWLIETPREAVQRTLYKLAAAVEANDVPGTLAYLAPSAGVIRSDVETLMPLVDIERARIIGTPQIDIEPSRDADRAVVQLRGVIVATVKQSGMKGAADDELTVTFIRDGGRWLMQDYTSRRNWHRAVGR